VILAADCTAKSVERGAASRQARSTACQFHAGAANHLTAVLNAIPKSSAASCRDTPDATASITRPRKSAE
jgi:hypothetical protein